METSITIKQLVSEARCYATIRQLRWAGGVLARIYIPDGIATAAARSGAVLAVRNARCQRYQSSAMRGNRYSEFRQRALMLMEAWANVPPSLQIPLRCWNAK